MHWSNCKINNVYAKLLVLFQKFWGNDISALLKSLDSIGIHFFCKMTCSLILQGFIFISQFILKVVLSISKLHLNTWKLFCKGLVDFFIDRPSIRGIGYIDVHFISISFSSTFCWWIIFVFWKPTVFVW